MFSRCLSTLLLALAVLPLAGADSTTLRVCADPNNLPFSNRQQEGFENRLASLAASDLGRPLQYFWQPQRRGFLRTTLNAGNCDLVVGVSRGLDAVATTRAYYRSAYVFVQRATVRPALHSFDDHRLRTMAIGVQVTGEDYNNPPATQALAFRQLTKHVVGFPVYGNYAEASPQRAVVDAVAKGDVETAVVWGPVAGYFAMHETPRLLVSTIGADVDRSGAPMTFDIAMAVRREDVGLKTVLDQFLERRRTDINALLERYGVPLLPVRSASGGER